MGLYIVRLKTACLIYVLAANKNNAIYKAYKKACEVTETTPTDAGFNSWKQNIGSIKMEYACRINEDNFNLF